MPDMSVVAAPSQYVMPEREEKVQKALKQVHKEDLAREAAKEVQAKIVANPGGKSIVDTSTPIDVGGITTEAPPVIAPKVREMAQETPIVEAPLLLKKLQGQHRELEKNFKKKKAERIIR